ncbi:MAG: MFS transporter, partial [Steroidobacteraceae bacterium]|nr:MFS transporter [Steroidobacteraceae bacterium]MDW8258519.1 MFS transporter [Gammaproteobacteria bacterium]
MTVRWWTQQRWWIAILLLLVTAIGSIDRQALSVTAKVIRDEFGLSNAQYGALGFAFLFAYAVGQLLAGVFVDRLGTKRSLSLAVIWWSIAAIAHVAASGFGGFFAARAFLGITEGANFPAAFKAIAEWFPKAERSMATGLVTAGTSLGLILAPPVAGTLAHFFGWQAAFIVPGLAGFLWVYFWQRQYELPERHPRVGADERALALRDRIGASAAPIGIGARVRLWGHYLRYRETWGLVLARFVGDGAFYFFAIWLPLYLQTERGMSLLATAFVAAIPFLFADLGSLGGGWLGQRLIHRGWSVDRSRKTLIWAGCLGTLVAWPVAVVDSAWLAVLLAALAVGSIQVKTSSLFPLAADIYPARDVATVWGMSGAAGSLGGALLQLAIGGLIDAEGYHGAFVVASLLCIGQAAIV